jgi:hypothetical protein
MRITGCPITSAPWQPARPATPRTATPARKATGRSGWHRLGAAPRECASARTMRASLRTLLAARSGPSRPGQQAQTAAPGRLRRHQGLPGRLAGHGQPATLQSSALHPLANQVRVQAIGLRHRGHRRAALSTLRQHLRLELRAVHSPRTPSTSRMHRCPPNSGGHHVHVTSAPQKDGSAGRSRCSACTDVFRPTATALRDRRLGSPVCAIRISTRRPHHSHPLAK